MTARQGLPLLYGLCDEWTARAQVIASLGGKPNQLDEAMTPPAAAAATPDGDTATSARHAQIAALAAALA
jgi:hypothetical protein